MAKRLRLTAMMWGILLFAMSAQAAPLQGGFSITGNFLPVIGSTGAGTTLGLATGLDFINFFGSTPTPGVDGEIKVNSTSGDFSPLTGVTGTIRDFTFAGAGSANYPVAPTVLGFQQIGGLSFHLLSVAVVFQTQQLLALTGSGIFTASGFENTLATFNFSGNGSSNTFSFSASQGANGPAQVPESASLVLLAAGLLGGGGYLRRRTARA